MIFEIRANYKYCNCKMFLIAWCITMPDKLWDRTWAFCYILAWYVEAVFYAVPREASHEMRFPGRQWACRLVVSLLAVHVLYTSMLGASTRPTCQGLKNPFLDHQLNDRNYWSIRTITVEDRHVPYVCWSCDVTIFHFWNSATATLLLWAFNHCNNFHTTGVESTSRTSSW